MFLKSILSVSVHIIICILLYDLKLFTAVLHLLKREVKVTNDDAIVFVGDNGKRTEGHQRGVPIFNVGRWTGDEEAAKSVEDGRHRGVYL